jgi:AcrR family transcriptional regulator
MTEAVIRKRRSGTELEAVILEAAWAELEATSWSGFRMEAVAKRAAVSKASLYDRWPSRGLLLRAAMQHQSRTTILAGASWPGGLRENLLELLGLAAGYLAGPGGEAMRGVVSDALVGQTGIAEYQLAFIDAIVDKARSDGELGAGPIPVIVRNLGIPIVVEHFLFLGSPPPEDQLQDIVDLIWVPALNAAAPTSTKGVHP